MTHDLPSLGAENITWHLDIASSPTDPTISTLLHETQKKALLFAKKYKGNTHTLSPKEISAAYDTLISLLTPLYQLSQYASLGNAADTTDMAFKTLVATVDDAEAEIANTLVFFELELGLLSAEKQTYLQQSPELKRYAYTLHLIQINAAHQLSEAEEKIITLKDINGVDALQKLYQDLTTSHQFLFELEGKTQTLNGSQLRQLRLHPDPNVRKEAMQLFFSRYAEQEVIFGHLYNHIVKDHIQESRLRGYTSAYESTIKQADLPIAAVEALHKVTSTSNLLVQRYYQIKKKLLNLPELTLSDIYAPLPKSNTTYTWDNAKEIVLDAFHRFDPEIATLAKNMFEKNRIHAPVTPNKRGGAFCSSSTPDQLPYVLVNYLGKPTDVTTLAHELGHAIHSMLAQKNHLMDYHPVLPLAETASVFAEMLVTDALLAETKNPHEEIALISEKLEEMFATSHRQNMFSLFEQQAFDTIQTTLQSTESLSDMYQTQLQHMFGDSVTLTPEYRWEWASIPHIFESPFYVYAYNFGNLLVMALYQQYKEIGAPFTPKYKAMLAAGRTASPLEIAALADIDLTNPDFWQKGIDAIETWVTRLETVVKKTT